MVVLITVRLLNDDLVLHGSDILGDLIGLSTICGCNTRSRSERKRR
jgi:hypothetical protein